MAERTAPSASLVCIECGRVDDSDRGWRAYLILDDDEPGEVKIAFYCPPCVVREFGDA